MNPVPSGATYLTLISKLLTINVVIFPNIFVGILLKNYGLMNHDDVKPRPFYDLRLMLEGQVYHYFKKKMGLI